MASLLKFVTYQLVRAGKRAHVKSQFIRLVLFDGHQENRSNSILSLNQDEI